MHPKCHTPLNPMVEYGGLKGGRMNPCTTGVRSLLIPSRFSIAELPYCFVKASDMLALEEMSPALLIWCVL